MFMNVRFANEGLIDEFKRRQSSGPIAVSTRELARITIDHMHSELKRSDFDGSCEDFGCSSFFWTVTPKQDLLFHCGCWIPLLIDYGSMQAHDDSIFEHSTLDGDYVAQNLADSTNVHFITDTDELFMVSFTPETTVRYSLEPAFGYGIPRLRTALKINNAHSFLYHQVPMNWLAKERFRIPVRYRGGDSAEATWRLVERHASRIVARMERGGNSIDRLLHALADPLGALQRLSPLWLSRLIWVVQMSWRYRRPIARRIGQIISGNRAARHHAAWRFRQYAHVAMGWRFCDAEPQT